MAAGCYEALRRLGLDIPGDVSVIGYDNQPLSRILEPPLTTLDLPACRHGPLGVQSSCLALGLRRRPVRLECRLIERQSVGSAS